MEEFQPKTNPIFQAYGKRVDDFFSSDDKLDFPAAIVPELIPNKEGKPSAPAESFPDGTGRDITLSQCIPEAGVKEVQEMVESLRRFLRAEKEGKSANEKTTDGRWSLQSHLVDFRKALASGNEGILEANPFYDLCKLLFLQCMRGAGKLFETVTVRVGSPLPEAVPVSRAFRQIWTGPPGLGTLWGRITETFGKFIAAGRSPLSLFLFAASTFTTARGVNDMLQLPAINAYFGQTLNGSEGELTRYLICFSCGFSLSSAILDYKARIFQSIAETGKVFPGIRDAILRHPRWMIVATLLTIISIKTNYDGIVSIISKKGDLAQQSQVIEARVKKALGSRSAMDPVNPDSLFDLQATLQVTTRKVMDVFLQVPEDEVKGVASSGDPRKGPRYWAKHFIVHGGYEAGVNDVGLLATDQGFAKKIDDMLADAGIDFSSSYTQKVEALRDGYEDHLAKTEKIILADLDKLETLMGFHSYSIKEINRAFALEHYQINDIVQDMVKALETNKDAYKAVSEDYSTLTNAYLNILQIVDKTGTTALSNYRIEANVSVPKIEAIDELKHGEIPVATHKNFEELRASLIKQYGVALGGVLLSFVLFFSISMDLGDPILFARMTARRGRRDRAMFPDRFEKLKVWEDLFLQKVKTFFDRPDVLTVFSGLTVPNETGVRNAFLKFLEEIHAEIKDNHDKNWHEKLDYWFRDMFRSSRTAEMAGYNVLVKVLRDILVRRGPHLTRIIQGVYPGIDLEKGVARVSFQELFENIEKQVHGQREAFLRDLQKATQIGLDSHAENPLFATAKKLPWVDWLPHTTRRFVASKFSFLKKIWFYLLFSAFKDPVPSFVHTRYNWLKEITAKSQESGKRVEALYNFVPTLKDTLFKKLPQIQEEILEPLLDFHNRFPSYATTHNLPQVSELQATFEEIEKESFEIWGVSRFVSEEPCLYTGLHSIIDKDELALLSDRVQRKDGDTSAFFNKVDVFSNQAKAALLRAQELETATMAEMQGILSQVRAFCNEVNQALMKVKVRHWEGRNSGAAVQSFSLSHGFQRDMEKIPQEADTIIAIMDDLLRSKEPYTEINRKILLDLKAQAESLQDQAVTVLGMNAPESPADGVGVLNQQRNRAMADVCVQPDDQEDELFVSPPEDPEPRLSADLPQTVTPPVTLPPRSVLASRSTGLMSSPFSSLSAGNKPALALRSAAPAAVVTKPVMASRAPSLGRAYPAEIKDSVSEGQTRTGENNRTVTGPAPLAKRADHPFSAITKNVDLKPGLLAPSPPIRRHSGFEGRPDSVISPLVDNVELNSAPAAPSPHLPKNRGFEGSPSGAVQNQEMSSSVISPKPPSVREKWGRAQHKMQVAFEASGGWSFEGATEKISLNGLDFISTAEPSSLLAVGDQGILRLLSDLQQTRFPCRVVRISGFKVALRLLSNQAQFGRLVAGDIFVGVSEGLSS